MEPNQITRLVLTDRHGKYSTVFARAGERVYAFHPRHQEDEAATLYPENGGIIFLYGGSLIQTLVVIEKALDRPLDYIMLRDRDADKYETLLGMSKIVNEETTIARVGRATLS
jgi:hypothetical protein